jgi:hypothetical protein
MKLSRNIKKLSKVYGDKYDHSEFMRRDFSPRLHYSTQVPVNTEKVKSFSAFPPRDGGNMFQRKTFFHFCVIRSKHFSLFLLDKNENM